MTSDSHSPKRRTDLLGQPISEPLGGEQREFVFERNTKGEIVTDTGVVTSEGLLRPDPDLEAEGRSEREGEASGQLTLPHDGGDETV